MIYLCIYSDALPFSSTISRGTCPSLPHEAIAAGWRKAKNYQGEWHVKNCELKWFLPQEACDLLGNLGKIVFNGDSLIHQLLIGLGAVLSGNYRTGGISNLYQRTTWRGVSVSDYITAKSTININKTLEH